MNNEVVNKSIYDKIIDKGSLDASEIINLGKQKALALKEAIISEAQEEANKKLEINEKSSQDKVKTMTTAFERLAKKEILFKKKELIDETFNQALNKLKSMSDSELQSFVKKYLLAESLTGKEVLKVNKADYGRYLSLFSSAKPSDLVTLDKLNSKLGSKYNLKLSNEYVNIDGGFIIVGEYYDIDLSFNSILYIIKEQNETEIADILYHEES
jgi:vacuolar-type H+-ATPase subunit E/Vma4